MNNIYLNQDPLLVHKTPEYNYSDVTSLPSVSQLYNQFNREMPQPMVKDWIGDLDETLKGLDPGVIENLNQNREFVELHASLQATVQDELMSLVRGRLNTYPSVIDNVKKQINIIKTTANITKENERQNMNELNDYMKNYSHLTFDEYKRLKNGQPLETASEVKNKKK